jgi:hypothetical protein
MLTYYDVKSFFEDFLKKSAARADLTPRLAFAKLSLAADLVHARCNTRAEVAELADAHGSGPCTRKGVEVQVLSSAPNFQRQR